MDWLTLGLTFLMGMTMIYYYFLQKLGKFEKLKILHNKPLPIIGNMAGMLLRQRPFVDVIDDAYKLNDEAKYVGLYDFGEPIIVIRSLELIKDMAIKHFDHFVDHRAIVDDDHDYLFGSNLFSLRNEKWRDMRTLLSPAFTGSKMKAMFKLMSTCGRNFANFFAEKSIKEPCTINAKDVFMRYTNDVIGHCAFGISVDSLRDPENDFYVLGRETVKFEGSLSLKIFLLRSFPRISKFFNVKLFDKKVEKFFEGLVRKTIEMRDRKGVTRPDMIQLMMDSRGKKSGGGPELTIQEMTAQAFVFFFGGFDTSSGLMCFVAYLIAMHEDVQRKLRDKIDAMMEETSGEVTYEALNGMEYLDAIINETLRVYAIAIIQDRICAKPYELPPALPGAKPITLQPGQCIWFPTYSIGRDPKYFPNPEKFDPERFIGASRNDIDPFKFIPFGQGPRMCIGNRFAVLETKVVIFHLLAKFVLKPSPKMIVPLELSTTSLTLTAKGGFWLELEPKENAA